MTFKPAHLPAGQPSGGQFTAPLHAEGDALAAPPAPPVYDPEKVAKSILDDLRDIPEAWTRDLFYGTVNAVRAGKTTYGKFLDGLIAKNRGGRCEHHEHDPGHSPEQFCRDCHVAFMVEARTNPKPLPVPRGVIPVGPVSHFLESQQLSYDYDEDTRVSNVVNKMTGDEQFEAAVRKMFNAPADATVEVIDEETECGTDWTRESSNEITVKCDGRVAVYEHMGSFMRALDQVEHDPQAMARRFMRSTEGERPLLVGIAAVYLRNGDYSAPKPVFGKIRNVFSGGIDPCMDFLYVDGRQDYLDFSRVVTILETDQSSVYDESGNDDE